MEHWISNLRQLDRELKRQMAFDSNYQPFFHAVSDFICILDKDHKVLFMNFIGVQYLGLEASEVEGRQWRELGLPSHVVEEMNKMIDQVFVTGKNLRVVSKPFLTKAGVRVFEQRLSPLYQSENEIIAVLCFMNDITEHVKTQTELRVARESLDASEARYRGLFNYSQAVFVLRKAVLDASGRPVDLEYVDVNPAYERALGVKAAEVVGRRLTEVYPDVGNDIDDWVHLMGEVALQGTPVSLEHNFLHRGTWYRTSAYSPKQGYVASISEDITERKRAAKELRDSEERWRSALENAGQGVWQWNMKTGVLYFSPRFKQIFGYRPDEMSDTVEDWESRVHPDDLEHVWASFRSHASGQETLYDVEYRIKGKDGGYRWVMARGKIVSRDEQGKPIECIGILNDITGLKEMEQALKEKELRYRVLFENVNDAIFLLELDAAGNPKYFREVNDVACHRLGYSREELISFSLHDIQPAFTANDRSKWIHKLLIEKSATFETTHKAKCGTLIPVEWSARYFVSDDVPYILAVARDLTERRRAEGLLKKSYDRKRRNDLLNELVKGNQLVKQKVQKMIVDAGINLEAPLSCYLLVLDEWEEKTRGYWQEHFGELRSLQDLIIDKLEECEEWVTWASSEGIGILHFGNADGKDIREYQVAFAERLRQEVAKHISGVTLAIGIAEVAAGITDVGALYRQSCIAVNMGSKIWPERKIYHYLEMGVFQLIPYIEDREQVAAYIERTLGKLLHYDRQKKDEYLLTLEVILESDNLKEAAKKAFVHQKTVELRKRRIEEILGVSLSNFETRMTLATAIRLMKLYGGR